MDRDVVERPPLGCDRPVGAIRQPALDILRLAPGVGMPTQRAPPGTGAVVRGDNRARTAVAVDECRVERDAGLEYKAHGGGEALDVQPVADAEREGQVEGAVLGEQAVLHEQLVLRRCDLESFQRAHLGLLRWKGVSSDRYERTTSSNGLGQKAAKGRRRMQTASWCSESRLAMWTWPRGRRARPSTTIRPAERATRTSAGSMRRPAPSIFR